VADAIAFFKDLDADLLVISRRGLGQVVSISELIHVALLPLYVNLPLTDSVHRKILFSINSSYNTS